MTYGYINIYMNVTEFLNGGYTPYDSLSNSEGWICMGTVSKLEMEEITNLCS